MVHSEEKDLDLDFTEGTEDEEECYYSNIESFDFYLYSFEVSIFSYSHFSEKFMFCSISIKFRNIIKTNFKIPLKNYTISF